MIPYGFHLLQQGPFLRTASGFLFAIGLVYYLSLNPLTARRLWKPTHRKRTTGYLVLVIATLAALLAALYCGGRPSAIAVAILGTLGFVALCSLVAANLALLPRTLRELSRSSRARAA